MPPPGSGYQVPPRGVEYQLAMAKLAADHLGLAHVILTEKMGQSLVDAARTPGLRKRQWLLFRFGRFCLRQVNRVLGRFGFLLMKKNYVELGCRQRAGHSSWCQYRAG